MKSDHELGMGKKITRRDLIHDASVAAVGAMLASNATGDVGGNDLTVGPTPASRYYPPNSTGMRGSHPGAFEAAHALAREGRKFPEPRKLDQSYDLVVVGAGISGLAAAQYYQKRFGPDARILLLENHDDFGGHAKRNEFHQGGEMRLSLGGTHNLEWWEFSDTVNAFMKDMGVDVDAMRKSQEFAYGHNAPNSPATWFDEASYGVNRLIAPCDLRASGGLSAETIDRFPLSIEAREQLKRFYAMRTHILAGNSDEEIETYLASISYPDFLRQHGGLGEEALQLFDTLEHGGWGLDIRAMSAGECLEENCPGWHLLGENLEHDEWQYPVAMWPDGNASLARLQVAALIPEVAPGTHADNVVIAKFDYDKLDAPTAPVRLRLNATVINAENHNGGVDISYVNRSGVFQVRAKHCVMACYHSVIPHLCSQLPPAQAKAMKHQVKAPLHLTNVLIRNPKAFDKLGIEGVRCPGRLHNQLYTFRGFHCGGYHHAMDDDGPVSVVLWGSISPPAEATDAHSQLRASRALMLGLTLEDYEREVRTVLDGLLGPAGFDVKTDVLAITVNRWPHGYAYEYLDLWDPDWPAGEAPHEIARQPFGNIAIANADAAAHAYTHNAIDEAYRAVQELPT